MPFAEEDDDEPASIEMLAPDDGSGPRLVSEMDAMDRPDADADVHSMASASGEFELDQETGPPEPAGAGESWLDEILDDEADRAGKRRDEGE